MASKLKKLVDDVKDSSNPELDLVDKGIVNILEIPGFVNLKNLTKVVLAHNKITSVPPSIANFLNLEIIILFNNAIEELPTTLSSMPKLKTLNVGMNRLSALPRGFGACPMLEVLDVTYNNLSEHSLPGNFFCLDTLRALYMGDNDFENLPPEFGRLKNLQILVLRDNDLVALPKEMGELIRLRELHIQGNRLTVLPPEMGNLDLIGTKQIFKADGNPWVTPIADQFQVGISHVFDYIRSDTYKFLYGRHMAAGAAPPPKTNDKSKKISRIKK
ncbi:ras suppressor protein 1 [Aplysia californica]|uniref:Ras suppressor protein 1 n=1 Tax=Aplysia californica TaxID=6500 RepID=A0ABM0JME8_APLCA|nr:ras suppressor protein 1 [Aplysia californica]